MLLRLAFAAVLLAAAPVASASVLVSNIAEPVRATTQIDASLWAAQSFINDGTTSTLTRINAVVGSLVGSPGLVAELHDGTTSGTLLTTFVLPSFSGAPSARSFLPSSLVTLNPGATYWLVLGASGRGSIGWSYAEGNNQTGTGSLGNYAYSSDQGATWGSAGAQNPYLIEVNVRTGAVPEPATWAIMLMGFAGAGAAIRRRRVRLA